MRAFGAATSPRYRRYITARAGAVLKAIESKKVSARKEEMLDESGVASPPPSFSFTTAQLPLHHRPGFIVTTAQLQLHHRPASASPPPS